MGWFEIWDEGFQRRQRLKNSKKLPPDAAQALRSDLAQIAGVALTPVSEPIGQEKSAKGSITKADREFADKVGLRLDDTRRGRPKTRR